MTNAIYNIDPYIYQTFGVVLVRTGGNLNLPDNATTLIPWQTVIRDTNNFWDIATPETITVRFTGLYLVTFNGTLNSPANGGPQLRILSSSGQNIINNRVTQSAGTPTSLVAVNIVKLTKNETVQCSIFQNSGGAITLNGDATNFPTFSMQLFGY